MVLGLDSAKAICNAHPELDAYFIYERKDGKMDIYFTNGMKKYLKTKYLKTMKETNENRQDCRKMHSAH